MVTRVNDDMCDIVCAYFTDLFLLMNILYGFNIVYRVYVMTVINQIIFQK